MKNIQNGHMLVVVYDSVLNSVFESQLLVPLQKMLREGVIKNILITTFEADGEKARKAITKFGVVQNIEFMVLKRLPLLGRFILVIGAAQLHRALGDRSFDAVRARGPLAGVVVRWLLRWSTIISPTALVVIQARGLCGEEYRFACEQQSSSSLKMWEWWRRRQFDAIEKMAYAWHKSIEIEAVSRALANFLSTHFGTNQEHIAIAQSDLLEPLAADYIAQQRHAMRTALHIPLQAKVYCYSGSCKPWQCAQETIDWFAKEGLGDHKAFLVIFSQDAAAFKKLAVQYKLPQERFLITSVAPVDVMRYLCVADVGILLRKPDVVNWVSRPTKLLEYQAAGLTVMHNKTIGILANN